MRKMKAQSVLQENLKITGELEDELSMARARTKKEVTLKATRLTFFCTYPQNGSWDSPEMLPENHILGYAVVLSLHVSYRGTWTYLLEAVGNVIVITPLDVLHNITSTVRLGVYGDEAVVIDNNDIGFDVIGDCPPNSICGSGLIDAVAVLLDFLEVDLADDVQLGGKDNK